ncbi:VirB8/TrbF family protein [Erwinia amylovora]|uniref:VirB8/TrbF family protein n=1 Tax=Erwinia amylovora TaxID=552 RepID=UPI0014442B89|nr:VirB8/TrbF family protein [Erwinia amylovora]
MKTKKETQSKTPAGSENPYLSGRREWNERYGSYIQRANQWRLTAIMALVIALIAVGGVVYIGSQSRLVPYLVQVDKLGRTVVVGRAESSNSRDPRLVRSYLANWIVDFRSVYTDASAQRRAVNHVYAGIDRKSAAYAQITDWYKANDPFKRAESEIVSVTSVSLPMEIGNNTWRVEWTEETRGLDGRLKLRKDMFATLSFRQVTPNDEKTIIENAPGIYMNQTSWSDRM